MKELDCLQNKQFQRDLPILEDYFKYCTYGRVLSTWLACAFVVLIYFL